MLPADRTLVTRVKSDQAPRRSATSNTTELRRCADASIRKRACGPLRLLEMSQAMNKFLC